MCLFFFFTLSHISCGTHCHRMWGTTKRCSMKKKNLPSDSLCKYWGSRAGGSSWAVLWEPERMQSLPAWVGDTIPSHSDAKAFPVALGFVFLCPFHLEQAGGGVHCEQSSAARVILDLGDKEIKAGWWNGLVSPGEFYEFLNPNNSHCIRNGSHDQLLAPFWG